MTTTSTDRGGNGRAVELRPAIPAPSRLGQATAVEQSRAVAEVHAAIVVAQERPRDINRAIAGMQRSCAMKSLADRAFYSYRRGGENVQGATVQLARELARCWGNIQYGLTELRRDDAYGQSEMQAWAWDVETNARASTTFIVPHRRDRSQEKGGAVALTDVRDIYENNANHGSRRLREMIFAILPGWYTEDATAACYATLQADDSDGQTQEERAGRCVERFAAIGVKTGQLEQRVGAPVARWSPFDLAQLGVVYRSIMRGETRREDEFGEAQARVTAADITGQSASPPREPQTSGPAVPDETRGSGPAAGPETHRSSPQPAPKGIALKLDKLLGQLQLGPEEDVKVLLEWLAGSEWTATRAQVQLVTGILEDHLNTAQGDTAEAASAVWAQYRAVHAQDAAEATAGTGSGDDNG